MEKKSHLPIGYRLQEYQIERVLGQGGFGITYLATDVNLDKQIVIKEFFPKEFSSRESNIYSVLSHKGEEYEVYKYLLKKFLSEAKILASLTHPNIITVTRFFEENSTAYFIMDYVKGESLKSYIARNGSLTQSNIEKVIIPILEGLKSVHEQNFLHRDIAPDNIYLTIDGIPMLIDFGSAKDIIGNESKSLATIVKAGYSAPEQYVSSSIHTKSTDIYGIGAVIVSMISGETPPEATRRQLELYNNEIDPLETLLNKYKNSYRQVFLEAILKSMSIKDKDRFQEVEEFQEALLMINSTKSQLVDNRDIKKEKKKNKLLFGLPIIFISIIGIYYIYTNKQLKEVRSQEFIKPNIIKNSDMSTELNITNSIDINSSNNSNAKKILKMDNKIIQDINKITVIKYIENIELVDRKADNNISEVNLSLSYFKLGEKYYKGKDTEQNKLKAVKLYEKSCDLNNSLACKNLGYIYLKGETKEKNINKAIAKYSKACILNNGLSCTNLGFIYDSGNKVKKDKVKAIKFYQKGCDLNNSGSCANLGYIYDEGDGIVKNDFIAVKLYKKSCILKDAQGCFNLAKMYSIGEGVLKSKDKAIGLYRRACKLNHKKACLKLK